MAKIINNLDCDDIEKYVSPRVEIVRIEMRETILQTSGLYEEEEEPWDE